MMSRDLLPPRSFADDELLDKGHFHHYHHINGLTMQPLGTSLSRLPSAGIDFGD
jgi:hypothetical protein